MLDEAGRASRSPGRRVGRLGGGRVLGVPYTMRLVLLSALLPVTRFLRLVASGTILIRKKNANPHTTRTSTGCRLHWLNNATFHSFPSLFFILCFSLFHTYQSQVHLCKVKHNNSINILLLQVPFEIRVAMRGRRVPEHGGWGEMQAFPHADARR